MNIEEIKSNPLEHLDYFTEWGNSIWRENVKYIIKDVIGQNNFKDKKLLDVGPRYGRMSVLFSLLGCNVTGIDLLEEPLIKAREEAAKFGVTHKTKFIRYNGDPDIFEDNSFDIIFTKSVLVMVSELDPFLNKLTKKLKPNGTFVSIENGRGNIFIHWLRNIRHRSWDHSRAKYFDKKRIQIMNKYIDLKEIKYNSIPPVYLFIGKKKSN